MPKVVGSLPNLHIWAFTGHLAKEKEFMRSGISIVNQKSIAILLPDVACMLIDPLSPELTFVPAVPLVDLVLANT